MSRIADKHGLTNKYRENGSKRLVRRGRLRKYCLGYSKPKTRRRTSVYNSAANADVSPKQVGIGCAVLIGIVVLFIVVLVSTTGKDDKVNRLADYALLQQSGHPILYDEYNAVKEYYKDYSNVSVGSYQVHPEVDKPVVTALSYVNYDRVCLITLNLNNLDVDFTLVEAIDIAFDYIPVEMILECFEFEKAIYKTKPDGTKQYECYYTQKEEGVEKPGYYLDGSKWIKLQSGFSLVIEETASGSYIVEIGDDWYAFVYNPNPIVGSGPSEEELKSHCEWDFSIEKYLETNP